jgi:hypothetical protein
LNLPKRFFKNLVAAGTNTGDRRFDFNVWDVSRRPVIV